MAPASVPARPSSRSIAARCRRPWWNRSDEIGELPLDAQVKLLRAIQTGEVDPVGGTGAVKVDIRLISATNRDLSTMIAEARFREDLYYRVGVFPLTLPPLRDRREDLPGLARMFLARSAAAEGMSIDGFSTAAMETICRAPWPGNVRQLHNTLQRAVILTDGQVIRPQDLHGLDTTAGGRAVERACGVANGAANGPVNGPVNGVGEISQETKGAPFLTGDGHIRRLFDIEAEAIAQALTLYRGRMTETARRLGIGRSTLYRKIDELQLDKRGG
jgi:DNA-binding NtrC family response regulator